VEALKWGNGEGESLGAVWGTAVVRAKSREWRGRPRGGNESDVSTRQSILLTVLPNRGTVLMSVREWCKVHPELGASAVTLGVLVCCKQRLAGQQQAAKQEQHSMQASHGHEKRGPCGRRAMHSRQHTRGKARWPVSHLRGFTTSSTSLHIHNEQHISASSQQAHLRGCSLISIPAQRNYNAHSLCAHSPACTLSALIPLCAHSPACTLSTLSVCTQPCLLTFHTLCVHIALPAHGLFSSPSGPPPIEASTCSATSQRRDSNLSSTDTCAHDHSVWRALAQTVFSCGGSLSFAYLK